MVNAMAAAASLRRSYSRLPEMPERLAEPEPPERRLSLPAPAPRPPPDPMKAKGRCSVTLPRGQGVAGTMSTSVRA